MKKMKWLGLMCSMMLLTACGGNTDQADNGKVSGDLVIWEHDPSMDKSIEAVISAFEEKYPDVNVEYESKASNDYYSLLTTALQSGTGPDIFWTNGTATDNLGTYVEQGKVLDITDSVDMSALNKDSFDLTQIDGKTYSVPWMSFDTRVAYYNKDIFKKLNLSEPTSFEDFEKMLATIKDAGYIPISLSGMSSWQLLWVYEYVLATKYPEYAEGFKDYSVKADSPEAREALKVVVDWANKGYFGKGFKGVDSNGQTLAFTTGEAAMTIDGSWMNQTIAQNNPKLNFGVFHIPGADGKKTMMGSFANGFSGNADSKNKAAVEAFLNFAATKEAQEIYVTEMQAVSGSDDIKSVDGVTTEIATADRRVGTWQSMLTKHSSGDTSAASVWEEQGTKVLDGSMTVDALMDKIGSLMD